MSAAWLTYPLMLDGSRDFECDPLDAEQCAYYMQRWHFWYIADIVYALPTIAFFMCCIGIFIIARVFRELVGYRKNRVSSGFRKVTAAARYLSYRGFYVKALKWSSAPVGLLLLAAVGTVYFFCMDLIPQPYYWSSEIFGNSPPLGTRSGWMALACMPFVFATASKANWITLVTGVSHERLQVFHRWISYAFFLLALMHTFPFIVYHRGFGDMQEQYTVDNVLVYWTGTVAIILQAWLTFASHSTIRNLGYEFFKIMHFAFVIIFIIVFFWHCDYALTSWDYFIATAAVYIPSLVYPWLRTLFEYGIGQKAHMVCEDNDFIRITIPANFYWAPGAHCFLRFTGFGMHALTTHPFTICSLPSNTPDKRSELTFYVRPQGGFTSKLHKYALASPRSSVPVLVDGPYGGADLRIFDASDRVVLIAGGSGAGWCLSFVELFARQSLVQSDEELGENLKSAEGGQHTEQQRQLLGKHGPSSLKLVIATRDTGTKTWFLQAVRDIFARYNTITPSNVDLDVHVTGDNEATSNDKLSRQESDSASSVEKGGAKPRVSNDNASHRSLSGRPHLPTVIQEEASLVAEGRESLAVYVCGPTTMQNDVRNAVAQENLRIVKGGTASAIYLHSEHFSWA